MQLKLATEGKLRFEHMHTYRGIRNPFFMYPPAAALINNGTVPLKRLRQKIYDRAFIFLDEMMNQKYKTFSENENLKGQFFCEGEKLKLAKLWL